MPFRSLGNRCIHLFVPPNVFHILLSTEREITVLAMLFLRVLTLYVIVSTVCRTCQKCSLRRSFSGSSDVLTRRILSVTASTIVGSCQLL